MYRRPVGPAAGTMVRWRPRYAPPFVRNPFTSPLWRNDAFVRVWSAATISIFGSLITRIALPLVAILTLRRRPDRGRPPARRRSSSSLMTVGLVAGAWVDRLRRRPVLIWADLGRAVLLGSIPLAFVLGALTFWQLLIVAALAAVADLVLRRRGQRLPADRSSSGSASSRRTARWQRVGRPPSSSASGSAGSWSRS